MSADLEERVKQLVADGVDIGELVDMLRRPDLMKFHLKDGRGNPSGVFDHAIFSYLKQEMNMIILGGVPFIYDGGVYRGDVSGAILKTRIRDLILPEFVKSTTIKRVYDLFIGAAELQADYTQLNDYPAHWINFSNGFYDPIDRKIVPHDPRYKAINQIPHCYDPDAQTEGSAVDEWLHFIAPDDDDREMLLEFAGLCMTRDTRQQKFLILNGLGGTGKSVVIRMIELMIGSENLSSISLVELSQRFAAYGLLGKLLNSCADLELSALEDTSTIKKILGEDSLRAEAKGKDSFSFRNYSKLIFSTNELPIVKAERTNGFYRRLLILSMNRSPDVKKADFFDQLGQEVGHFIRLCVEALQRMYERGVILESRHSVEAVERLWKDSDTVAAFLSDEMVEAAGRRVERELLYERYQTYCHKADRQSLARNSFYRAMRSKNFGELKSGDARYFTGLAFNTDSYVEVDEPLPFL